VTSNVLTINRLKGWAQSNKLGALYLWFRHGVKKRKLKQIFHFVSKGHLICNYRIKKYLHTESLKRLQIGGGYHTKQGWINGDLIAGDIYLDAARRFPFPDESIDLVFAEQFIEHLSFEQGSYCLRECCRVLKKGGKIRLSTPDLENLCSLYKNNNPDVDLKTVMARHKAQHNRGLTTPCHLMNDFFRLWGHSFIYDEQTLRMQLGQAGFSSILRRKFGQSDEKSLQGLERHADVEWMKNAFQLIVEANKE